MAMADALLVKRCLAGERQAWGDLYDGFHELLIDKAMSLLGARPDKREVSDEIAARVWYCLIADDFNLLRQFDGERGCRLQSYLATICHHQLLNYRKSEKRRRARETAVSMNDQFQLCDNGDCSETPPTLPVEFHDLLTPREKEFCETYLLADFSNGEGPEKAGDFSQSNIRQLRTRVRRKLVKFIEDTSMALDGSSTDQRHARL